MQLRKSPVSDYGPLDTGYSTCVSESKFEYEPFGHLDIGHGTRHGQEVTIIRSRYRGMAFFCLGAGLLLVTGGYFMWRYNGCLSIPCWLIGGIFLIIGPTWFSREDRLIIEGETWHYESRVDFGKRHQHRFTREEVVELVITRQRKENGNYALKLSLGDQLLLLYSDQDVKDVREAGQRVSLALRLPLQEKL